MASITAKFKDELSKLWKDDFAPLEVAGGAVLSALREEEAAADADLYRRIASTASNSGSHLYFRENVSPVSTKWKHVHSEPLPPVLVEELRSVRYCSFMGLLTPASLAWMSVDYKLFLWSFRHRDGAFCCFEVPSRQSIVSVGLVKPKKGVFTESVEWCLVVTTVVEIHLCALVRSDPQYSNGAMTTESAATYRLVPTSFILPTDGVRVLAIQGTDTGRIFLGGEDGSLYEMTYEGRIPDTHLKDSNLPLDQYLDHFYDQGKSVPSIITTDAHGIVVSSTGPVGDQAVRALSSWNTSQSMSNGEQPRKCRKLDRTSHTPALVRAVLPDFITKSLSLLFGGKTSSAGGQIVQMVVDEHRKTLYTLSAKGWICSFDFRPPGIRLASVMDATKTARIYLEAVSRGQMIASTGHSSTLGRITFPGGSSAAQAGVGGMDGARSILKLALDSTANGTSGQDRNNLLKPVSIHVVAPTESSRVTLVAVTSGGLRLYISSLSSSTLVHGPTPVQGSRQSRTYSSALAPAPYMTLCHVRSPPTAETSGVEDTPYAGGTVPRLSRSTLGRVDASWYGNGQFVAAIEPPRSSNSTAVNGRSNPQNQIVGDVLVAASPDAAAREVVQAHSSLGTQDAKKERVEIPGGITELVSLPMSTAYGEETSANSILQGGLVWDMAVVPEDISMVHRLSANSQTPSDSELSIGLPPAFFAPSQIRTSSWSNPTGMNGASTSRALVPSETPLGAMALSIAGNALTHYLFNRPIRAGIQLHTTGNIIPAGQPSYRLSRRDGSRGFSLSAAEGSARSKVSTGVSTQNAKSSSSRVSRSARLRPWLLEPAPVALNTLSTQHLSSPSKLVAINAGGLQYFESATLLDHLSNAIVSAGNNVGSDPGVTAFFKSYGYKEGCAMCLSLAVGCGPAAGDSEYCRKLRQAAVDAALKRAFVPMLLSRIETNNGAAVFGSVSSFQDPLSPQGYDFKPSALSEALHTTFCRLVRPIWHKPAAVVTEGPCVRRQWMASNYITPAKVEVLIDDETANEICRPLQNLSHVLKTKLSRAVKTVPGMANAEEDMMDISSGTDSHMSETLRYLTYRRGGQSGTESQLTVEEAESIAHLIEEKNIHSLYRLLARTIQLLDLVTLLRQAHTSKALREVNWGMLHGLTFAQLAQTSEGQDRLESLLNSLVTSSASGNGLPASFSAQADQIAQLFAEKCYLFFSPGSRYAYLGLRQGSEALACHSSSSRRSHLAREAAEKFRRAAQHWHSARLITGRILHRKDKETYSQIAQRAMHYGSPLANAVDMMVKLGDATNAVDICLSVASNFKRKVSKANVAAAPTQSHTYELVWEQNLYHKRRELASEASRDRAAGAKTSSASKAIVAYGADVTPQDAVETCYALIFHYLSLVLSRNDRELAVAMVRECASSHDIDFMSTFFSFLLESNNAETLVMINSPEVEKWLKDRKDAELLWKYYSVQGRHKDAGQILWENGSDPATEVRLLDRLDCLRKAMNSLKVALDQEEKRGSRYSGGSGEIEQRLREVENSLLVGQIQSRILHHIESMDELPTELSLEKVEKLRNTLVGVSDLYNEYASVLDLYECCLQIFHVCRHDETDNIRILWKHVVCKEILPCSTRTEDSFSFLQGFASDIGREGEVLRLLDGSAAGNVPVYENADWAQPLAGKIVSLGKDLYGSGADYVFPVHFLLSQLEGLRQSVADKLALSWSLTLLASASVPYLVILDTYESVVLRDSKTLFAGGNDKKRLEELSAVVELLGYWVSASESNTRDNSVRQELARAVTSGRLLPKLDAIKSSLETSPSAESRVILERARSVENSIQSLV